MTTVTGRIFITVNGQRLRSREGASLETGGVEREAQVSDAGVDGFSEKVSVPGVDFELTHTAQTRIEDIHAITDGVLTFETDSGRIYTLTGATSTKPPKLTKGVISCSFQGKECIEG